MDVAVSRTLAVNTIVVAQMFFLLASRFTRTSSLRKELFTTNPISRGAFVLMGLLQVAFVYLPFMNSAFASQAVDIRGWLLPVAIGIVIFLVIEVEKAFQHRARSKS